MPNAASPDPHAYHAWWPGSVLDGQVGTVVDYRMAAQRGRIHRGMPGPWLTVVISYEDAVPVLSATDDGYVATACRTFVGGLHRKAALLPQDDPQWGVQLDVAPLAALALFGVTAAELAGRVVDLDELWGRDAGGLADALADARPGPDRFRIVQQAVRRRLESSSAASAPSSALARAWDLIVDSHGRKSIAAVADEIGWSRRHLSERMRRATGLGPKELARTARFQYSQRLIRSQIGSLAEVAARCGYADQSHLTAQWRELAGCTPGAWLAAEVPSLGEFPFLQDDRAAATAS